MPSQETINAIAAERIAALEDKLNKLAEDRDKALKWGIITLGSIVIGLLTWIFNFFVGHFK